MEWLAMIPWDKIVKWTIIGVILFLVLRWIGEFFEIISSSDVKDYKDFNARNLTLDNDDYQTLADVIFNAAHGWGTDEEAIYNALSKLNTKDDWKKLVYTYGTDPDGFTLPGRLIYELDSSEQNKVREILKNINVIL